MQMQSLIISLLVFIVTTAQEEALRHVVEHRPPHQNQKEKNQLQLHQTKKMETAHNAKVMKIKNLHLMGHLYNSWWRVGVMVA